MIISASFRTDIPAFYPDWLMNRVREGFCMVKNPYSGQHNRVDLSAPDGFLLWTKDIGPLMPYLDELRERAPFVVTHTVTGYGPELEPQVNAEAIENMHRLAERYGPRAVVWRYDPIVLTPETPAEWHVENFRRLAAALAQATDEVIASFATYYSKTTRNMAAAGVSWTDPDEAEKARILSALKPIAAESGIDLRLCCQSALLAATGCKASRCADADRLSDVAGRPLYSRQKGNRPGCNCAETRDIGAYDTCAHGCLYCYAVSNHQAAGRATRAHDPLALSLSGS
jgi:hypothetical protein